LRRGALTASEWRILIEAVIPGRSNRRLKIEQDWALYRRRNQIERILGLPNINRAIAT
jgi:hypothetical protein